MAIRGKPSEWGWCLWCWNCAPRAGAGGGIGCGSFGMAHSLQWVLGWAGVALCIQWTSSFWDRISPELPRENLGPTQRMQCEIPAVTANVLLKV